MREPADDAPRGCVRRAPGTALELGSSSQALTRLQLPVSNSFFGWCLGLPKGEHTGAVYRSPRTVRTDHSMACFSKRTYFTPLDSSIILPNVHPTHYPLSAQSLVRSDACSQLPIVFVGPVETYRQANCSQPDAMYPPLAYGLSTDCFTDRCRGYSVTAYLPSQIAGTICCGVWRRYCTYISWPVSPRRAVTRCSIVKCRKSPYHSHFRLFTPLD